MSEKTKPSPRRLLLSEGVESCLFDPSAPPRLSRSVQAQIGERLRIFYETLKLGEEPVPERFIEIINRLDRAPTETPS